MPTYEYACKSCGERLEVTQSFSDPALTECPACGGELRKVFHPIGVAFKGSGFYKNDSRKAASSSSSSSSSETSSTSDKAETTTTKTESTKTESSTSSSTPTKPKPDTSAAAS